MIHSAMMIATEFDYNETQNTIQYSRIPKEFYYNETQSTTHYSRTPTGSLSIQKLIDGNPCWITPTLTCIKKPKTLILADWTITAWSNQKTNQVKQRFNQLLEQGFSMFIWCAGQITLMNQQNLSQLDSQSIKLSMTLASIQEVSMAAIHQHKLTLDQIQIIDDYWLNHLLSDHAEPGPRILQLSEIPDLTTEKAQRLFDILNASTPNITSIIIDEFSENADEKATLLIKQFKTIAVKHDYQSATLTQKEINTYINHHYITRGCLFLDNQQMNNLIRIQVTEDIPIKDLQSIIKSASNLKQINLSMCYRLNETLVLDENSLLNLEHIDLSYSNITSENLKTILDAAPNLKTILLNDCNQLNGMLELSPNNLTKLEHIDLSNTNILLMSFEIFNLKFIQLRAYQHLENTLDIEENSLLKLKFVDFSESNLTCRTLQILLKAAPNLTMIDLSDCQHLQDTLELKANSLLKLESIALSNSNIPPKTVQTLLKAAPNLKIIILNGYKRLNDLFTQSKPQPLNLEGIDLSHSTITLETLQIILKVAPYLKTVKLNYCQELYGSLELAENSLIHLKKIELSSSSMPLETLQILLKAAPNLKKITLNHCQNLHSSLKLAENSLIHLEEVDLSSSSMPLETLQILLKAAPNLKKITLNHCQNLHGTLILEAGSLSKLKQIQLYGSNLSNQNIEILLNAAPNLDQSSYNERTQSVTSLLNDQNRQPIEQSNPTHSATRWKDFRPKADEPFKFKGQNNTKSQGMILEKLCHYLSLSQKHQEVIPKLKQGICLPLSHYFLIHSQKQWDQFITMTLQWNGQDALSEELITHFDNLYHHIEQYQLTQQPKIQYIGNTLSILLTTKKNHILNNPWHSIAIKPTSEGNWLIYDPNFITGYQEVKQENLVEQIHQAIGSIISIESDDPIHNCTIPYPGEFIAHGGLITLCQANNVDAILAALGDDILCSKEDLDGLLLRATSGKPAWAIGLMNTNPLVNNLIQRLFIQFQNCYPKTAAELLKQSLDAISALEQGEIITRLIQVSQQHPEQPRALITAIRTLDTKEHYERALKTWHKTTDSKTDAVSYCHTCISSHRTKRLIELNATEQLNTLRWVLEQQAAHHNRAVFYIDKPDDLICSAPWMKKNADNTGTLHHGPGGPLYEFLKTNKHTNPLLIVNYEQFNADDIVRFNGLLDNPPHADGTNLPDGTMIIGLINRNKPNVYQGSDFYSRFHCTEECPLSNQQLIDLQSNRTVDVITETLMNDQTTINLYHAPNWEERLLGQWMLDGDVLSFHDGALIKAIQAQKPIHIQNGNWDDEPFKQFWQHILNSGIRHAGRTIQIPPDINITRPKIDAYTWNNIPEIKTGLSTHPIQLLTPTNINDFFRRYELEGTRLIKKPGWIELSKQEHRHTLEVNLTRTLSDDAWAMVLDECTQHHISLVVHCAPGVSCPAAFQYCAIPPEPSIQLSEYTTAHHCIIVSTEVDTSIAMLTRTHQYLVIDVSECSAADLLNKLDGSLNNTTLHFEFSQSDGALTKTLADKKNVILKGRFSAELIDALTPILLSRKNHKTSGQLVIVTDDETIGTFMPKRYAHQISPEDKMACLAGDQHIVEKLSEYLKTESLSKLKARYHYLKTNPSAHHSDEMWLGMNSVPDYTSNDTTKLDKTCSAIQTTELTNKRLAIVNKVLDSSPYVFLTGLSGVGKSTFVEQILCQHDALYPTESRIHDWAIDQSPKRKILFIDEANLNARQWSEFEGLFSTPPHVLINGELCLLTQNHKVVFAGNPIDYGGERTQATFFQNHGNAVLFTPLPVAVIYETILKPICLNTELASNVDVICDHILNVYQFICECSTTELLISPRELQMMALLTIVRAQKHPEQTLYAITEHFCYELAKNLIPSTKQHAFDAQFKPKNPINPPPKQTEKNRSFLITPSRQNVSQQLEDLLELRHWRRECQKTLTAQQITGGLGGIIIEGEPGIGKSELIISELIAHGYTEERDLNNTTTKKHPFYRMPVSMPLSEKEALLIKAFHEGAIVIIDEINSSPMMERLLNDLLMGKNPKANSEQMIIPGFMIIGTQNPISMAGRRMTSTALKRRLITTILPEYEPDEIKTILLQKGVAAEEADLMIQAYLKNRASAIQHNWSPIPNFRNLIHLAEDHLKSIQDKRIKQLSTNKMTMFQHELIKQPPSSSPLDNNETKPGIQN